MATTRIALPAASLCACGTAGPYLHMCLMLEALISAGI